MSYVSTTRRQFLVNTSLAIAGTALATFPVDAKQVVAGAGTIPTTLLPEPVESSLMRALAMEAINAAKGAGASYADVRVAERHRLHLELYGASVFPFTTIQSTINYGVRVIVDGTWAFIHGTSPSVDAITKDARSAVQRSRAYARHTKNRVDIAPVPVVTGEWNTPFEIDPFSVPLEEQAALLAAYRNAAGRVHHGGSASAGTRFRWGQEVRVFASSEGSLVTQVLRSSEPYAGASGNIGRGDQGYGLVNLLLPKYSAASGGYETVAKPGVQDEIKELAETAVSYASLPRRSLDVGRYPIVMDGMALGETLLRTIGPALELDRVLGDDADGAGTSYLSPSEDMLGAYVASPQLNLTATRKAPTRNAVKWDDEGVEADDYTLIRDGKLVDYHTSRANVSALKRWYDSQGAPSKPHGCSVSAEAHHPVLTRAPHLSVAAGAQSNSIEDLCKDIRRGVLLRIRGSFSTDHQLSSGSLTSSTSMFIIDKGQVAYRVLGNGLQFNAKNFWKALASIGDQSTLGCASIEIDKGQPWRRSMYTAMAPAGLFKEINVISTKIKL